MSDQDLIRLAMEAREHSYSPYSHFMVGAALLAKNGKVYQGCNIENAGYTPSNCAERTAFFKAVSEGVLEFETIAIVAGPKDGELIRTAPCGVCRQVMMEFCEYKTFRVLLAKSPEDYEEWTLEKLLPFGFGPKDLA
ncbi:MAG: cytidine deaminase [Lachnospiraceae bacterium]|nr:cytidine deaminase [Lachnospiraceae bacterium]MBR6527591.1 cytidine deaminase [Lachnospiraceae bacterium]